MSFFMIFHFLDSNKFTTHNNLQLEEVETLDVINVTIFPEYILPVLNGFPSDKEVLVRAAYAGCIAQFAQTALHYLELAQVSASGQMTMTDIACCKRY